MSTLQTTLMLIGGLTVAYGILTASDYPEEFVLFARRFKRKDRGSN